MIKVLSIHFKAVKLSFAGRMAYRGDFLISTFITLISEMVIPLVTILIYRTGASFPGWSLYEILLIQAVFLMARGIAYPFLFGIIWNTLGMVREGTFDLLLIKPQSAIFMSIIAGFDLDELGKLFGGSVLFAVALFNLPAPNLLQWIIFILLFIISIVVLFSCALIMSGTVFKWVGNGRVHEIFDSITTFGKYPVTIFPKWIKTVLISFIPVSLIAFFPASALLGRSCGGVLAASAVSVGFLAFSLIFWHLMLKSYTSSGG